MVLSLKQIREDLLRVTHFRLLHTHIALRDVHTNIQYAPKCNCGSTKQQDYTLTQHLW